jgi:hypothetical protein
MTISKSLSRNACSRRGVCGMLALAAPAGAQTGCGDTRDGQFFGYIPESNMLVVTCWPVIIGRDTVVEDLNGNPVDSGDAGTFGEELKTTGCVRAPTDSQWTRPRRSCAQRLAPRIGRTVHAYEQSRDCRIASAPHPRR